MTGIMLLTVLIQKLIRKKAQLLLLLCSNLSRAIATTYTQRRSLQRMPFDQCLRICGYCDSSGGDDNTTINHIYCPIFHFQLILVEATTCKSQRCIELKLNFAFYFWFCQHSSRFMLCVHDIRFGVCMDLMSIPYRIVFNKFSASQHRTDPIVKQIRNTFTGHQRPVITKIEW